MKMKITREQYIGGLVGLSLALLGFKNNQPKKITTDVDERKSFLRCM
jgi:hypothetical protein